MIRTGSSNLSVLFALAPWSAPGFAPVSLLSNPRCCTTTCTSTNRLHVPLFLSLEDDDFDDFPHFGNEDRALDFAIDSFLRGEYDRPYADDAPAPHPGLTPQATVEAALESLRKLDDPEPSHGAAVLQRFLVPLSRRERWGDSKEKDNTKEPTYSWKEVLRGALTPTMLARRIRATQFSGLLDWERLDVTEGAFSAKRDDGIEIGFPSSLAFVNAALYFEEGVAPVLVQFTLKNLHGVWLIDDAKLSQQDMFMEEEQQEELGKKKKTKKKRKNPEKRNKMENK